jgi:ureidoacrylate peracid hydrolase
MHSFEVPDWVRDRVIARHGRLHTCEALDPAATALLVVDMQNFFVMAGQPAASPEGPAIVPNINRLARALRGAGGRVVWIATDAPAAGAGMWATLESRMAPRTLAGRRAGLNAGDIGYELWAGLDIDPVDRHVIKNRYSAFIAGSSDLEAQLRADGVDTVLVAGVATNVCCESTARDAMMRGFVTVMVSDANASFSDAEHQMALWNMMLFFGDVHDTEGVVGMLEAARADRLVGA